MSRSWRLGGLTLTLGLVVTAAFVVASPASAARHGLGEPVLPGDRDEPTPPLAQPWETPNCGAGNACFWKQTNYDGEKQPFGDPFAGVWRDPGPYDRSAKNAFGNRLLRIGDNSGGDVVILGCLDPGDNDPSLPTRFDAFFIGNQGSRCTG